MIVQQFFVKGIAHSSYLLGGSKTCVIVDPQRHIDVYLEAAADLEMKITHILETHLHADFISGHLDLAAKTGAKIYIRFAKSEPAEALALFEKALELRPDDPAFLEMAGRCHINLAAVRKPDGTIEIDRAAFEKALAYLEKAKTGYADDPDKVKFMDELIALVREQIKK